MDNWQVNLIDDVAVKIYDVCVHTIRMSDVEDPDLYVAHPIWEWQQSEAGKFVMENAEESPYYRSYPDITTMGYTYQIRAKLRESNLVFYNLKWKPV